MNIRIRKVKVPKRIRIKIIQKLLLVAFFFLFFKKTSKSNSKQESKELYLYIDISCF